jgi:conjugal transfer pilin signal peptidase TrbI
MTADAAPLARRARWPRLALFGGLAAAVLTLSALAGFSRDHALMINASPSLPYWALWVERGVVPQRGDLVLFDPPRSELLVRHFGAEPRPFGKRVYGVAGDVVTSDGRSFFINGKFAGLAKPTTRLGEPLELGPVGTIPRGCLFVATPHKDGFDSRYAAIGWICRDRILGVGRAIL